MFLDVNVLSTSFGESAVQTSYVWSTVKMRQILKRVCSPAVEAPPFKTVFCKVNWHPFMFQSAVSLESEEPDPAPIKVNGITPINFSVAETSLNTDCNKMGRYNELH